MGATKAGFFCDGACKGNPGVGGWGCWIKLSDGSEHSVYGGEAMTTNNRMELSAAIMGLKRAKELLLSKDLEQTAELVFVVDSKYVKDGVESWLAGWKRKGWKTSAGQPVKNEDLWRVLDALVIEMKPKWMWVKGHSGHVGNQKADDLANLGVRDVRNQAKAPSGSR